MFPPLSPRLPLMPGRPLFLPVRRALTYQLARPAPTLLASANPDWVGSTDPPAILRLPSAPGRWGGSAPSTPILSASRAAESDELARAARPCACARRWKPCDEASARPPRRLAPAPHRGAASAPPPHCFGSLSRPANIGRAAFRGVSVCLLHATSPAALPHHPTRCTSALLLLFVLFLTGVMARGAPLATISMPEGFSAAVFGADFNQYPSLLGLFSSM